MKKNYIQPDMKVMAYEQTESLLTTSTVSVGSKYTTGDVILSRRNGQWEEDDEEEE